jgi:Derlin-2/3
MLGIIRQVFNSTPPVTRTIGVFVLIICILYYTEIADAHQLIVSKFHIKTFQLHRILTSSFYFGPPNFDTIIHIFFLLRYSRMLEEGLSYTSDFVFFLLFVEILVVVLCLFNDVTVIGPIFSSIITYVWTRMHPRVQIQLLGCFVFPAFYLPFILPLFSFFSERRLLKIELFGILIGHVYFFLKFNNI